MASKPEQGDMHEQLDEVYRSESRRILATLIRLLGDFDLAEEALHDAFRAALEQWPRDGVPASPRAWLVSAGRFRAIDTLRRRARFDASLAAIAAQIETNARDATEWEGDDIPDDRLRLIFTCCHPVLPSEARMALTLREVCGLTTEEIARAFLTAVLATYLIQAENTKPDETSSQHRYPCATLRSGAYRAFNWLNYGCAIHDQRRTGQVGSSDPTCRCDADERIGGQRHDRQNYLGDTTCPRTC